MQKAEYFIRRGETRRGPTSASHLRDMAAKGSIKKTDQIQRGEDGDWYVAMDVAGLFDPDQVSSQAELIATKAEIAAKAMSKGASAAAKGGLGRRDENGAGARQRF